MTEFTNSVVTVLLAILGIAALALILSRQSTTSDVLNAGSNAFSGALRTALSPQTGTSGGTQQALNLSGFIPTRTASYLQ